MRKLSTILLSFLLSSMLFLTACGGSVDITAFDAVSPWIHGESLVYEIKHYTVEVRNGVDVEYTKAVIAEGQQTVTTRAEGQYYVIITEWFLDFVCAYGGITVRDEITTSVRLSNRERLYRPVESSREVIIRRKVNGDGFIRGDVNPGLSHIIGTNYSTLTSVFTPIANIGPDGIIYRGIPTTETMRLSRNLVFDNESLFFIVRAFDNLGGQIQRFNLSNMFDFHRNGIRSHSMIVTPVTTETQHRQILNPDNFVATENTPIVRDNEISTHAVQISLDSGRAGQPILAWFAANDYYNNGNTARKLLVEYMTHTLDFMTNTQTRIRYRLERVEWV